MEKTEFKKLLLPADVCEILGISLCSLHYLKKDGRLPAVRLGRRIRFRREDVDAYIESLSEKYEPIRPSKPPVPTPPATAKGRKSAA